MYGLDYPLKELWRYSGFHCRLPHSAYGSLFSVMPILS